MYHITQGKREETHDPPNILINMEEPKWKKRSYYYIIIIYIKYTYIYDFYK